MLVLGGIDNASLKLFNKGTLTFQAGDAQVFGRLMPEKQKRLLKILNPNAQNLKCICEKILPKLEKRLLCGNYFITRTRA